MTPLTYVEAQFGGDGQIRVRRFTWQARQYTVTDHGRQWDSADGRHLLLMTAGEGVFELLYDRAAGTWALVKAPAGPTAA